jgi:hypothetical protein
MFSITLLILICLGMAIWVRVPSTRPEMSTGMIFYPWVVPVPDPKQRGYVVDNFFRPWVTRQVPEKIEIFNFIQLF